MPTTSNTPPNLNEIIDKVIDKDGIKFTLTFDTVDMIITVLGTFVAVLGAVLIALKINSATSK